ncbi:rRNA biogenesis protein RRP5 [Impatiens glandulifera]|uniref:rRNA biogenesis protein RRP5 n=1 Tax=Impatiens glandulifera TaxID=253017 RepID=UPI001FB07D1F|nr:rRNA biogenesis protein RRP5 [Impatiens glandulifera]
MAPPSRASKHAPPKSVLKPSTQSMKQKSKQVVHAAKSEGLSLQLEDDAPDFPRGGASLLSSGERDKVRSDVNEGDGATIVLRNKKKNEKRGKKLGASTDDDAGSLFGGGITGKLPRYANRITLKNISPGMKLWGVISEINDKDLVISLPGGLRGLVRASDSFDPVSDGEAKMDMEDHILSRIYHVGQLVSCIVLQLDEDKKEKGRKIWLSLRLSLLQKLDVIQEGMVLTAYVKSIEDHGYILHFGLPSFTGFMPKNSENGKGSSFNCGQHVQGVVKRVDMVRKVIYMSFEPDIASKVVMKELKGISIDLLTPGMMVNARVQSTLENGVLMSFLTYFTGTVDFFHLQKSFPSPSWKNDYNQNKKVNARILFVDPSTRAVGLTLNPYLVNNKPPPIAVKTGDIFDHSKVIRVDKGVGLLLEIPSLPVSTPAYVIASDVSDKEAKNFEKNFKEGLRVRVRVLGYRHLEGYAMGILKTSAFEGSVFTHSDVKPGMVVKAKVVAVDSFGAIVQFRSGVKALCPLRHMSEFEIVKPRKKFQVGAELIFRVLGSKSKRITVTQKKTLVKSKLEIIASYVDAVDGLLTHGWIAKIENHGCLVRFYNGVQGFAPRSELLLEPGSDPNSTYHVEQVVKCRVTSSAAASKRINLSFVITPTRLTEDDAVKLGSVISGEVVKVFPLVIVVKVNSKVYTQGTLSPEHLADHQGLAKSMMSGLKPGYIFDRLLVLDTDSNSLILSAKHSLVDSAHQLPSEVAQIHLHSVLHGYICNVIESGCFVRFLGRLTGFAPRSKAVDDPKANPVESFYVGQSVRSYIADVNSENSRVTLSLKQSFCSSMDASFIQEYFLVDEKISKMSSDQCPDWIEEFNIGSVVEGRVIETNKLSVVISFEKHTNILGFITHHQLDGSTLIIGSSVKAAVLDISKSDYVVDLSMKQVFIGRYKEGKSNDDSNRKKRKREVQRELKLHQKVNAVVEIVKENYLVLSIPEFNHVIGYASLYDYNTQKFAKKQFDIGQSLVVTVMEIPSSGISGRLLLFLQSMNEISDVSTSKRKKMSSAYDLGSLVQAEITEIKPLELRLKFGSACHGRVHITEVTDDNIAENPLDHFRVGETLSAIIISKANTSENIRKNYQWELSLKTSLLNGAGEMTAHLNPECFNYSVGQNVTGFVNKVDSEWVWLGISHNVNARLHILDSAYEPSELKEFEKRYSVGKAVSGYILTANKEKRLLRLVMHPLHTADGTQSHEATDIDDPKESVVSHICKGHIIGGRISRILPGVGGVLVQIGPNLYGKVHYTELTDLWSPDPLSQYHDGQFVKCRVLEISPSAKGTIHIDLSLRLTPDRMPSAKSIKSCNDAIENTERIEDIQNVRVEKAVQGYVKNVSAKGCFIMLSRKLDAKILLSNLSGGFVKSPEEEFPIGKLVSGRVVSVEPLSKRIEVTLRNPNSAVSGANDLKNVQVGDIVTGRIRRVEKYGLFISIDHSSIVALCHISQLSDDPIDDIASMYKAGEQVSAKIIKVDEDKQRVSLGMKSAYLIGHSNNTNDLPEEVAEDDVEEIGLSINSMHPVLAEVEARASVPALEVSLDDVESSDMGNLESINIQVSEEHDALDDNKKRRLKKKAKEEKEKEIRAAEERLLEKDIPRSADEFEKLVRTSPNNSFIWIKYMAFLLSLSEIEKARSIAERALKTINFREESEKLNIWVAYLNLENKHGNPPEDAVSGLFHRALQHCDAKKVHIALLGMYERTEQHGLADVLLSRMLKKFKHSCKVWLKRIQWLLTQNKDSDIQSTVKRAVLCLPQRKHTKFLSQTAILEFKSGTADRGRSIFEGILREYPKRIDLWTVYLDQEIRHGDEDIIHALFERATSLSLPPKKMKSLFKKYLEYEKTVGNEERIEYVKAKALEYVENSLA